MSDHTGVTITPAAPRSIAGIAAFRDRDGFLAAFRAQFGVTIPTMQGWVQAGGVTLSCLGPARYLASADSSADLPGKLAKTLAGLAAITDQSDMWDILNIAGPAARDVLSRLVPIDLTPTKFRIGHLASTRAGHMNVRLWRIADLAYEVAVARSYAADLRSALQAG